MIKVWVDGYGMPTGQAAIRKTATAEFEVIGDSQGEYIVLFDQGWLLAECDDVDPKYIGKRGWYVNPSWVVPSTKGVLFDLDSEHIGKRGW